jgi:hypothetical protein
MVMKKLFWGLPILVIFVFLNMKALIAPFSEPTPNVRVVLSNCQAFDEAECIVEGTRHYEFFTNDTFMEDKDGVIIRLEDNDIAAQAWSSAKKPTLD